MTLAGLPSIPTPARQHTLKKLNTCCKHHFITTAPNRTAAHGIRRHHHKHHNQSRAALAYLGVANKAKEEGCAEQRKKDDCWTKSQTGSEERKEVSWRNCVNTPHQC